MEQLNDMVDQQSLNELALFAGAGGGILGGKLLGWRTVCAVEWEPYPASVLCARQNDGLLPPFPIWDDVQTFDGKPWRGIVDVVSGGFPCQDISAAGKGAGIEGERSGMWREMARIIREVRPRFVFVENSPMLTSRGLGAVLGDLATMGFDAKWGVLGAADIGANHQRDRIWIRGEATDPNRIGLQESTHECELESQGSNQLQVEQPRDSSQMAYSERMGWQERASERREPKNQETPSQPDNCSEASGAGETVANTKRSGLEGWQDCGKQEVTRTWSGGAPIGHADWWSVEPNVGRVVNGVAARMERIKAIGNGQVPLCAATAWRILK
jgi:DNA (cytosine-5)-methyltransferase 1